MIKIIIDVEHGRILDVEEDLHLDFF